MAYIYQADIYCDDCAEDIMRRLRAEGNVPADCSDDWPKWCDGDAESDTPQHCASGPGCLNAEVLPDGGKVGYFFGNDLTSDGIEYVKEAVREGGVVADLWRRTYSWIDYPKGFDLVQRMVDNGNTDVAFVLDDIIDNTDDEDERRLAAFLLWKHQEGDTHAPDAVEVAGYDDCMFMTAGGDYLVLTEDEANERWDDYLDQYLDDCILPEVPEAFRNYFDYDAWKRDARYDGRGHCLAGYDGDEHEVRNYYIYRTN